MPRRTPTSTLFPYTTLFRSRAQRRLRPALVAQHPVGVVLEHKELDRKSTRLNSSHRCSSYAVFCLKKKKGGHPVQATAMATSDRRESSVQLAAGLMA